MSQHKVIVSGVMDAEGMAHLSRREEWIKLMKDSFAPGTKFLLTAEEYDDRLTRLWSYYWAVVVPYGAEHHGYTRTEFHAAMKYSYNPTFFTNTKTGEMIQTGESTMRMSKAKQIAFVERCIQHLAEEGVNVPPPTPRD
jgi:hypothetical protein